MGIRPRTAAFIAAAAVVALIIVGTIIYTTRSNHDASGPVTWWVPNWDVPIATELVAAFEKENPGLTVEMVETTSDTMANRISVALDSGNTPDVITELVSRTQTYVAKDQLADLSGLFGEDMPRDDFMNGTLDATSGENGTYGIPFRWDAIALIYNPEMLAAVGAKPPTNFEEFVAAGQAVAAQDEAAGVAWPMNGTPSDLVGRFTAFALSAGATVKNGALQMDVESSTAALEIVGGSVAEGWASPSSLEVDNTGVRELFINKRIAMYVGGVFDMQLISDAGIPAASAVIPGQDGPGMSEANGWGYIVPAKSDNIEGAKKLVAFLTRPENMATLTSTYPSRLSAATGERFHDKLREAHFQQLTEHTVPAPNSPEWVLMAPFIYGVIQAVALGTTTPEDGAQEIQDEADRVLGANG